MNPSWFNPKPPTRRGKTDEQSLNEILPIAKRCAGEAKEKVYIVRAPIYVDEHDDSNHVCGTQAALQCLAPKLDWMTDKDWAMVGVVDPNGEFFVNDGQFILTELRNAFKNR